MSSGTTAWYHSCAGHQGRTDKKDFPFINIQSSPGEKRPHLFSQVYINCEDGEARTQKASWEDGTPVGTGMDRNETREHNQHNLEKDRLRNEQEVLRKEMLRTTELHLDHDPEHMPETQELSLSGCLGSRPF